MAATTDAKRKRARAKPKEISPLSVRLDADTVARLDELAEEREPSRADVLARAVREYVDREYAALCDVREDEKDHAAGRPFPPRKHARR